MPNRKPTFSFVLVIAAAAMLSFSAGSLSAADPPQEEPVVEAEEAFPPSHEQTAIIEIPLGDQPAAVQTASEEFSRLMAEYTELREQIEILTTSPQVLAARQRAAWMRKRAVNSIAVSDQDVFVACPSTQGFGYDVWRMDLDLNQPQKIVTRLSGCCGQMDIQASDGKLYVAENSRKRVVCYDREGERLCAWGKSDRKGVIGFGSCCNPMNLRFGPDGSVYTSESSLGRIKRFTPDGEFLGLVGTAQVVPGCKHVAVGVSPDSDRVYLLDITRKQIVVLGRIAEADAGAQ